MISKGNHVKFSRFLLLSGRQWRSKNTTSRFASLTEQDIEKIVEDKDSQNTKMSTKVAKELFADYVKEKKLREPEEKKELAQTLKTFYVEARKKGFVQCIIKQLLDSVFVISRITKVSTSTLIILDITKTSSNNCLKLH